MTSKNRLITSFRNLKDSFKRYLAMCVSAPQPNRKMDDDGFIPKMGLQYNITDDVMIYGVYSEGFRTGGVNSGRTDNGTFPVAYDSDTVENKEGVGRKGGSGR